MAQLTVQQSFDLAVRYHDAGQLREAEQIYRQIIAVYPRHGEALHRMGILAQQVGNYQAAVDFIGRSIAADPGVPEAHNNLSVVLRKSGQFSKAIGSARRAIAMRRGWAEAHYNLGLALRDHGDHDAAIDEYKQAIKLKPNYIDACNNLGIVLGEKGELDQAIALYRKVISIDPAYAKAHLNLGIALHEQKKLDESHAVLRELVQRHPDYADAHLALGNVQKEMGQPDLAKASLERAAVLKPELLPRVLDATGQTEAAQAAYEDAITRQPQNAELYHDLGNVCRKLGRWDRAVAAYQSAIAIKPDYAEVMNNLGVTLRDKGQLAEAESTYRKALAVKPDYGDAYSNLSITLKELGRIDEAIAAAKHALSINPKSSETCSNLASAYVESGELDDAIAAYRQAASLKPELFSVFSSLLYALNLHPGYEPQSIADEHRQWNAQYASPLAKRIRPHTNSRDPDRRLRIGYVSADFCSHAVSAFTLTLLTNHDRTRFEIFCYSDVLVPDAVTQQIQNHSDKFRHNFGRTDNDLAKTIREDQIDILVDLAGHTAGNRLLVFAQKPAPVQVSYLGYPATTGLDAIDYRLTDVHADPPGMTESFHSEKLIRLPRTNWCYQPPEHQPAVSELPAITNRFITFGCFNNFAKINPPALRCWAKILQAVPGSKLLLKGRGLRCEYVSNRVRQVMEEAGARQEQVDLRGWVSSGEHLSQYGLIDIALDAFPYNGTTTTCESILMGVPVVTFFGKSHVARVGGSLLTNLGLPDLVGDSSEQYMQIAIALANDLPRLAELRRTLRERLQQSPLTDGPTFARDIESTYQQMWRAWCATPN